MSLRWKFLLLAWVGVALSSTANAAALSSDPMAVIYTGNGYEHRFWATTLSGQLAEFSQADGTWRVVKENVRGGVAAASYIADNVRYKRVFVPQQTGIADLTLEGETVVVERTLTTAAGDQFTGSDVSVIARNGRFLVAATSTTGKFCVWVGSDSSALRQAHCSGEGAADPEAAIIENAYNEFVFYYRSAAGSLHAANVWRQTILGGTRWVVSDYDVGVPPMSASIGPALALYSHAAASDDDIAVVANNKIWIAHYDSARMTVRWAELGTPAAPPKAHRSALHMDGTWYTSFTSDRTHCNTLLWVAGQDGQLYQTSGHGTTWPGKACVGVSYAGNTWSQLPDGVVGSWVSMVTTPTHQSNAFRWIKHYTVTQQLTLYPTPRFLGRLMELDGSTWLARGNP